jgi:hypothetical protein
MSRSREEPSFGLDEQQLLASRVGAEWGMASLITGSVLVLIAPITLLFNLWLWLGRQEAIPHEHRSLAYTGAVIALAVIGVLALSSVIFGLRGLVGAFISRQPAGLPLAGVCMSLAAVVLWLIVGVDLIMILSATPRPGGRF